MPPATTAHGLTESQEDILTSVEIIAQERKDHIIQTRADRAREEARHEAALKDITRSHRDANRVLVQAIEAAHSQGLPKSTIYERIGMTTQRYGQLRRQINAWDLEDEGRRG